MKRFLRLFLVFALAFILIACNKNADFPKVNDNDKVELTYNEVLDEFEGVAIDNQILQLTLNAEVEAEGSKIKLDGTAHFGTGAVVLNLKIAGDLPDGNINGEATIYGNNTGVYFNGEVDLSAEGMDMSLKGKYKLDAGMGGIVDEEIDFNEFLDLDINEIIQDEQFQKLVEEYEGLTFYKKGNKFQLRLIVNNELLVANEALLKELLDMELPTDDQDFNLEFVLTVEDKKLTELGFRIDLNDTTNDLKLKATLTASVVAEMPALPNDLDEYKDFNFMDLM